MVHTIEFFSDLKPEELNYIINKFNITNKNYINFSQCHSVDGVNIEIKRIKTHIGKGWRLYVFADVIKLLGRAVIGEGDREEVLECIRAIVYDVFSYIPNLKLYRIDFRFDVVITDEKKRSLLIKLYNKCDDKKAYMEKVAVFNKKIKRTNKYSSLRYKNNSKSLNIYDKVVERAAKNKNVMDYEKNVLRFEAQVKRKHILYMKKQYNIEDNLETYFTAALYNVFMSKIVVTAIENSDYYNTYYAEKIINSSDLKQKEKEELTKFLKDINGNNKLQNGKKLYSSYKYNKCLKQLKELNINPITIPKNAGFTMIENPIKDILI